MSEDVGLKEQFTIEDRHAHMVKRLSKSGDAILASLTPQKVEAWHHASCIMGEAGELFDAIKKWVIYDQPLKLPPILEENGDIEFYLEGLRQVLNIMREEGLKHNMEKLAKRYPNYDYTDQRATQRADKAEEELEKRYPFLDPDTALHLLATKRPEGCACPKYPEKHPMCPLHGIQDDIGYRKNGI